MNIEQFKKFKKKKEFVAFVLYYSNNHTYENSLMYIFHKSDDLTRTGAISYSNVHSFNDSDSRVRAFIRSSGTDQALLNDLTPWPSSRLYGLSKQENSSRGFLRLFNDLDLPF